MLLTTNNREEDCILCLTKLLKQKKHDIEIILLNDWHIETSVLKEFCQKTEIRYIHTGSQKNGQYLWRVPGFALNIGIKQAKADYIIIGNAEILQCDDNCVEQMYKHKNIISSPVVLAQYSRDNLTNFKQYRNILPFFWGLPKEPFIRIGGYDEDYVGVGYEDNDISERMRSILDFETIPCNVIHLWNTMDYLGPEEQRFISNSHIYANKKGILNRNENRDWGIYNS